MAVSNAQRTKALPGRRWSGRGGTSVLFRQVHYLRGDLGSIGFLARWRRQGRVPLELSAALRPAQLVFDHAEYWVAYADDLLTRDLDCRILVGHPYRFDEPMRAALIAACDRFALTWTATPPGAAGGGVVPSWYSKSTWLITLQSASTLFLPEPRECKIKNGRAERRPLSEGETLDALVEKPSARARKARRAARAGLPPQISFTDAIADTAESLAKLEKWRLLQEKRAQIVEMEKERDLDRALREADERIAELSK